MHCLTPEGKKQLQLYRLEHDQVVYLETMIANLGASQTVKQIVLKLHFFSISERLIITIQ